MQLDWRTLVFLLVIQKYSSWQKFLPKLTDKIKNLKIYFNKIFREKIQLFLNMMLSPQCCSGESNTHIH